MKIILFLVVCCLIFVASQNLNIKKIKKNFYKQHNCYRKNHGSPPLKCSKKWANSAQNYADKLARENVGLHHSQSNGEYGENIFWWSAKSGVYQAVKMWYDEIKNHDYNSNHINWGTGHFTQIVWKATKLMGCGISVAYDDGVFVVCQYYPIGNYDEHFLTNVTRHKVLDPKC
uniref:SCP domain-containing protein n=1 Tax=Parastrongyloides trichosuri TaxID=131310 RepID=A0A0N4Z2W9_PARTI